MVYCYLYIGNGCVRVSCSCSTKGRNKIIIGVTIRELEAMDIVYCREDGLSEDSLIKFEGEIVMQKYPYKMRMYESGLIKPLREDGDTTSRMDRNGFLFRRRFYSTKL